MAYPKNIYKTIIVKGVSARVSVSYHLPHFNRNSGSNIPGGWEAVIDNAEDFGDCTSLYSQYSDTADEAIRDVVDQASSEIR